MFKYLVQYFVTQQLSIESQTIIFSFHYHFPAERKLQCLPAMFEYKLYYNGFVDCSRRRQAFAT